MASRKRVGNYTFRPNHATCRYCSSPIYLEQSGLGWRPVELDGGQHLCPSAPKADDRRRGRFGNGR